MALLDCAGASTACIEENEGRPPFPRMRRTQSHGSESVRAGFLRLIEFGLYAAVFAGVYFLGAALPDGYAFLEACVLLLGMGVVLSFGFKKERRLSRTFLITSSLLILWLLFLSLQTMAVPAGWVARVSPRFFDLWNSFSEPDPAASSLIPLTVSTESSWVNLGKSVAYAGIFFIAYSVIRDEKSFRRFGLAVLLLGSSVSVVGIFFHRFFPGALYGGLVRLEGGAPLTPYVNKNQFANLLAVTLPVTAGVLLWSVERSSFLIRPSVRKKILWLASSEATPFYLILGCLALQLTALVFTASRGGLLGTAAGFLVFAILILVRGRSKGAAVFLIGALCFILLAGVFQAKPLLAKFRALERAPLADDAIYFRLSNWKDTIRMCFDFPVLGAGAGGFHEIFPLYKTLPNLAEYTQVRFFHADNDFLELLAETGVVGAGLIGLFAVVLAAGFLREWFRIDRRAFHWIPLGVFSGSAGMLAHAAVDFPTHVPANMALFAVYGGFMARVAFGGALARDRDSFVVSGSSRTPAIQFGKGAAAFAGSVLLAACFAPVLWRQWNSDRFFLKGQELIEKIAKEGNITFSATAAAYEDLLKAKRYGPDESRIDHALGRILLYRALLYPVSEKGQFVKVKYIAPVSPEKVPPPLRGRQGGGGSSKPSPLPSPPRQGEGKTGTRHVKGYEKFSRKRETLFLEAEKAFRGALTQNPLNALYHYSLGYLYEQWGRFSDAVPHLEKAARLEPMNPFYQFREGENHIRLKSHSSALEAFKRAVKINHAYLEPFLKVAAETPLPLLEEDYRDLIVESASPDAVQNRLALFYELREDHARAALIRHFALDHS